MGLYVNRLAEPWFVYWSFGRSIPPFEVLNDQVKASAGGWASTRHEMWAASPAETPYIVLWWCKQTGLSEIRVKSMLLVYYYDTIAY